MKHFSPRDIVLIIVSVCATFVLTPVAVMAAASQLVTVKDPSTSSKARVDAGKLRVGDGSGPVTVDGTVKVQGSVNVDARLAAPTNQLDTINDLTLHSGDTRRSMFAGVGNKRVALTSLIASAEGGTAGSVELLVIAYVKSGSASGDCETLSGFGAAERFTVMVPVGQTVNLNFPSPLVWTQYAGADDYYCINVESYGGPTGYTAHVSAYGFRP